MNFLIVIMLLVVSGVLLKRISSHIRLGEIHLFESAAGDGFFGRVDRSASAVSFWAIVTIQAAFALAATALAIWLATHGGN